MRALVRPVRLDHAAGIVRAVPGPPVVGSPVGEVARDRRAAIAVAERAAGET